MVKTIVETEKTTELGFAEILADGFDPWVKGEPVLRVRCGDGWLIAYPKSDPGYYSEIGIDLVDDNGRCLQLAVVGRDEDPMESPDFLPEYKPMHVYPFNGIDEMVVDDKVTYVTVDEGSYWYE